MGVMAATKRIQIAIRLTAAGLQAIEDIAAAEERTRSDTVRKLLSEAIQARQVKR